MLIEEYARVKKTYDKEGKKWQKGPYRNMGRELCGQPTGPNPECTFEEMLREAVLHRECIDAIHELRVRAETEFKRAASL